MSEYVRRIEAPEWGRQDVEWWLVVDQNFRAPEADEVGRACTVKGCPNEAVAVSTMEMRRLDTGTRFKRRRFHCEGHLYGRVVEDGRVLKHSVRFDKPIGQVLVEVSRP